MQQSVEDLPSKIQKAKEEDIITQVKAPTNSSQQSIQQAEEDNPTKDTPLRDYSSTDEESDNDNQEVSNKEVSESEKEELEEKEEEKIKKNRSKLTTICGFVKNNVSISQEIIECSSIAYSNYLVLIYDQGLEGKYGYSFVAVGGLTGGINEILHINSFSSDRKYKYYQIIKEALAGATIAAIFIEDLLPENLTGVAVGGTVLILLTSSKVLLEALKDKNFFKTNIGGKLIQYSAGGVYDLMMGAGIANFLFAIVEGFGTNVNPITNYSITSGLAVSSLLAGLPIFKENKHNIFYQPARSVRAALYGSKIALFLVILLFDMITDIQESTDISDPIFYTIIALSAFEGLVVIARKLLANEGEKEQNSLEEYRNVASEDEDSDDDSKEESDPLLNDQREEKKCTLRMTDFLYSCWSSFWHTKQVSEIGNIQEHDNVINNDM